MSETPATPEEQGAPRPGGGSGSSGEGLRDRGFALYRATEIDGRLLDPTDLFALFYHTFLRRKNDKAVREDE